MKKHVVTGPIRQCHPTITNSYSNILVYCQMFLLIHFETQELRVIITTNTQTQPENFQEILQISRRFPGVSDTLSLYATLRRKDFTFFTQGVHMNRFSSCNMYVMQQNFTPLFNSSAVMQHATV